MMLDFIKLNGRTIEEISTSILKVYGGERKAIEALEYYLRRRKLSLKDVNHIHAIITELERKS